MAWFCTCGSPWVLTKLSRLFQAILAVWNPAELTVTVRQVTGFDPARATSITAIFCVTKLIRALGLVDKEYCIVFIECELSIVDLELATSLNYDSHPWFVWRSVRLSQHVHDLLVLLVDHVLANIESLCEILFATHEPSQVLDTCLLSLVVTNHTYTRFSTMVLIKKILL